MIQKGVSNDRHHPWLAEFAAQIGGWSWAGAKQSRPQVNVRVKVKSCGGRRSNTMMVMITANTPSENAATLSGVARPEMAICFSPKGEASSFDEAHQISLLIILQASPLRPPALCPRPAPVESAMACDPSGQFWSLRSSVQP